MIYLDHAAATPLDPRVFEQMKPYFTEEYGNPSSIYKFAQNARRAIDQARADIAGILNCTPRGILFTSSGTESNNLFIFGVAEANKKHGRHIVATKIEHDSVLKPLQALEERGFSVTYVDVGENGIVDPRDIAAALRPDTVFVTVMYANNEIGTIQPIADIAKIISSRTQTGGRKIYFHTDACQAAEYLDISVKNLGVDAMTLNGGKIYGPKGAGMLYVKETVDLTPQIYGGGQEYRKRSGTENVPAIAGFAEALKLAQSGRERESTRLIPLRDKLIDGILNSISSARLNGDRLRRLPNNVNVSFRGLEGEAILLKLDIAGICASSGSACTSGSLEPSHVVRALGFFDEWTHSSTRFTCGRESKESDIDFTLARLPQIIKELREISPFN